MKSLGRVGLVAALVTVAVAGCGKRAAKVVEGDVAIVGVTVVPMDHEGVLADHTVVVRGASIVAVAPAREIEARAARVIDGRGKWLVPGLADMHVHLWSEADLPLFLWNGVTTVRNLFGSPQHVGWRDQIRAGTLDGPTLVTAGPILDGDPPVWPGSAVVTTPDGARAAVREQKAAGYDVLKVYNGLSPEVYDAILDEAKAQGMPVDGHVPKAVGIEKAIASGQRTIEHLDGYVPFSGEAKADAATIEATVADGVWNCPTLVVVERMARMDAPAQLQTTRGLEHVSAFVRTAWDPENDFRLASWTPERFDAMRAANEVRRKLVGDLARAGARIVLGTDTGNPYVIPGFAVHDELALLVGAGLTRWQALRAATAAPAEMLGTPGAFGVVTVGARADLLLVDGDPLADLAALATPGVVIVRGAVRTRDELGAAVTAATAAPTDPFASLDPLPTEGEPVVTARYEVHFRDQKIGAERATLSSLPDGTRILHGQAAYDAPTTTTLTYRSTRASLALETSALPDPVSVTLSSGKAVATAGAAAPLSLDAAPDAIVAPQTVAEFFWYAQALSDLAVGASRTLTAVEVMTDTSLRLDPGTFVFTRSPDADGRRVYAIRGTHGTLTLTGTLVVDPDGAPHEVTLVLRFGTVVLRRVDR